MLHNLFGSTFFEDTASEGAQALCCFGIFGAAARVENADLRALFVRIPHALSQLEMGLDQRTGHVVSIRSQKSQRINDDTG